MVPSSNGSPPEDRMTLSYLTDRPFDPHSGMLHALSVTSVSAEQ